MEVDVEPRYWEDAELNGKEDVDGKMPMRKGDNWKFVIDVDTGQIYNWPKGNTAKVFYKVCDTGTYTIHDEEYNQIMCRVNSYVPSSLCIGENGYGDYIGLEIDEEGFIQGWKFLGEEDWEIYTEDCM
jgi:hypothetical protein